MTAPTQEDTIFRPDPQQADATQLADFWRYCESATGRTFPDQAAFYRFSVDQFRYFWRSYLEWSTLLVEGEGEPVCRGDDVETAEFFPELRLNYVENLLREVPGAEDEAAVVAHHDSRAAVQLTRRELRRQVAAVADSLRERGVQAGDRVVAVSTNTEQLVVASLSVLALGATLSTTAPDLGTPAILSRFAQLDPTLLFYGGGDVRGASSHEGGGVLRDLVAGLPTLREVVLLDERDSAQQLALSVDVCTVADLQNGNAEAMLTRGWERFAFSHPLWILFSSGTTGPPKCIVHTAGGALLEHHKEHVLHGDLRSADVLFFQTSPAWMMWNWLLSALVTGATIVLNDAPVTEPGSLWSVVERTRATVFGTSATYLQVCESAGYQPGTAHDLAALRVVMSTGSVLYDHQFDWVRENLGPVPLQSISGGTDIVGCFLLGSPVLPVRRGRLQCRSLGLDVRAHDPDPVTGIGELTCHNPFPSRPAGLLGDASGEAFHAAYFAANPGLWTHGDLVEIGEDGSARIHGRSDGVMNINGLRIAPAELYNVLADMPELKASMAVEQRTPESQLHSRMVLLVVMNDGISLDGTLEARIRKEIGHGASAMHVPALIAAVDDLPRTYSGKDSERAVRDVLSGNVAANSLSLRNPESVESIRAAVGDAELALARRRNAERESLQEGGGHDLATDLAGVFSVILGLHAGVDDSFFDLGGTSLQILELCQAVETNLGYDLPLSAVFTAATPALLSQFLRGDDLANVSSTVQLREGDPSLRPIFVIFDATGDVLGYLHLVERLPGNRAVYGVRARGLDARLAPDLSVEDMAESAIDCIRAVQPGGVYTLVGNSFGGLVAFEAALRLTRSGMECDHVVLLDTYVGGRRLGRWRRWPRELLERPGQWMQRMRHADTDLWSQLWERFVRRLTPKSLAPERASSLTPLQQAVRKVSQEQLHEYIPGSYEGSVLFVRPKIRFANKIDPLHVWRDAISAGQLTVLPVGGGHFTLLTTSNVDEVVEVLTPYLSEWSH